MEASETERLNILLIDDNQDDRTLALRELKRAYPDLQAREILNGGDLDAALDSGDFQAVITDFQLGWSNGVAVLKRVRAKYPDCPVIMFTATAGQEDAVEAMKAGLDDYVLKSANHYGRLPGGLRSAIRHRRAVVATRLAEERLREREAWFSTTLEHIGIGILTADLSGQVQSLNPEAERLTGWTSEEARLRDVDEVLVLFDSHGRPLPESRARKVLRECARSVDPGRDYCLNSRDGRQTAIIDGAFPLFVDRGRFAGVAVTLRDITERKRMENELLRSNEELQQFAYAVSHDLQEPLRTILVFSGLLAMQLSPFLTDEQKELMGAIEAAGSRMSAQIRAMLEYGRLSRDGSDISTIPLEEPVQTALANLQAYVAERNGRVTCGPLPMARVNRVQLTTVFQNLIANGLKYNESPIPTVRVAATDTGEGLAIVVEDNGIGIPASERERVFGLFVRLNSQRYDGTGIGLALVKRLVERAQGRIWLDPETKSGSRFLMVLPFVEPGAK